MFIVCRNPVCTYLILVGCITHFVSDPLNKGIVDFPLSVKNERTMSPIPGRIANVISVGRTLINDAEQKRTLEQNATGNQLKMFLTRIGKNAKFIVTGDVTQIDLPRRSDSGLLIAEKILKDIEGISIIHFNDKDILRHRLVKHIIDAYIKHEDKTN